MKFFSSISVHQVLLDFNMLLFWKWLKSTFTNYEDDISYGIKLEQEYQNIITSKNINT